MIVSTTEIRTSIRFKLKYKPIIGMFLAAFGVYSVINCKNTVKAKRIVIVSVIFSPNELKN